MDRRFFDRRDFHKLTTAALGGLAAGSLAGCGGNKADKETTKPVPGAGEATLIAMADVHLCRGLNDCKGKGKGGDNSCRGEGACATAKEHTCGGQNDCKGLGGCGETVGANKCKGEGGCHVPLMEDAWKTLREKKEKEWTEKKLDIGQPPPAKKE